MSKKVTIKEDDYNSIGFYKVKCPECPSEYGFSIECTVAQKAKRDEGYKVQCPDCSEVYTILIKGWRKK